MSADDKRGMGPPDLGRLISRSRLIEPLLKFGDSVIVLSGPGGYGKTTLAAQLAVAAGFDHLIWVESGTSGSHEDLIARSILYRMREASASVDRSPLLPTANHEDTLTELVDALGKYAGRRVCVVLDDVIDIELRALETFASLLRKATSDSSCLVVTCRDHIQDVASTSMSVVGASDMRLDFTEADALISLYAGHEQWDSGQRRQLIDLAGGLPAILCVLVKHAALRGLDETLGGSGPTMLYKHLRELAISQLDHLERHTLCAMALVTRGTLTMLREVVDEATVGVVERIVSVVPLVRLEATSNFGPTFRMHDLAASAFGDRSFAALNTKQFSDLVSDACQALDRECRYEEILTLAARHLSPEALAVWTERRGSQVLASGCLDVVESVLLGLGASQMLQRPRLLLLQAELLRETSAFGEALRKTSVARDLALYEADPKVRQDALLMMARMQMDLGDMRAAVQSLEEALSVEGCRPTADSEALAEAYLGFCAACIGDLDKSALHIERAMSLVASSPLTPDTVARVTTSAAAASGVVRGRWSEVLDSCTRLSRREGLSLSLAMQCKGNLGCVLSELARLARAKSVLTEVLEECEKHGLTMMRLSCIDSLACVYAGLGDYDKADELTGHALEGFRELSDYLEIARILMYQAVWMRANQRPLQALELAEASLEHATMVECEWLTWMATLEIAASLLMLGDEAASSRQAARVREVVSRSGLERQTLTADLILAEAARRAGRDDESVARLLKHEDYIRSESANWFLVMYSRAFPHTLGTLCAAMGAENLPAHMLQALLRDDVAVMLSAARDVLDPNQWASLARRLNAKSTEESAQEALGDDKCYVRMFGGLDVRVGERVVSEKAWKKSKARLLFALLALKHGGELPRDQVLDYLWSDMEPERALNNFYVIWSAMRSALKLGQPEGSGAYVISVGGMCRINADYVQTDVAEFEHTLRDALRCEDADNLTSAIRAYERLTEIYRGELLPGDVYEDWFTSARDRYRVEFGDAMLRGSRLIADQGDPARAIGMLRKGLEADPHREDLYQAAMELQILCRQRSGAIETFMSCRKWLSEDLGLDPSAETMRLYEQVLAMDERADYGTNPDPQAPSPRQENPELKDPDGPESATD